MSLQRRKQNKQVFHDFFLQIKQELQDSHSQKEPTVKKKVLTVWKTFRNVLMVNSIL